MDTSKQIPSPAETRASVLEAIEQGQIEASKREAALEANAAETAAVVIARIPTLVREATASGDRRRTDRFQVSLMPLGLEDTTELLDLLCNDRLHATLADCKKLIGAARLVYEHCSAAGFHVYVARNKPDGQRYVTYSLAISWTTSEYGNDDKPAKKERRRWRLW